MKVKIERDLVNKIRSSDACSGLSNDEFEAYLEDLVNEQLQEHLSDQVFKDSQSYGEDNED